VLREDNRMLALLPHGQRSHFVTKVSSNVFCQSFIFAFLLQSRDLVNKKKVAKDNSVPFKLKMTSLMHVALKLLFWPNNNKRKGTHKDKGADESNKQTNKNVPSAKCTVRKIKNSVESHRALLSTSVNLPPSVVVD